MMELPTERMIELSNGLEMKNIDACSSELAVRTVIRPSRAVEMRTGRIVDRAVTVPVLPVEYW
jgi:hypothetical protein